MAITFRCEQCQKTLEVPDEFAGQEGACPSCGAAVQIPAEDAGNFTDKAPIPSVSRPVADSSGELVRAYDKPIPKRESKPSERGDDEEEDPGLVTHYGNPVEYEDDFFVDAPKEIGKVMSAFTSLKTSKQPMSAGGRFGIMFFLFAIGAVLGIAIGMFTATRGRIQAPQILTMLGLGSALGALGAFFGHLLTRFKHTCNYVGKLGIATFTCAGDRDTLAKEDVFLYEDAVELRIGQTRNYYNGAYTGTTYAFNWTNNQSKQVFGLAGSYSSEAGTPHAKDPFYFALAAETAWTLYLFGNMDSLLGRDDELVFGLKGNDYVELRQDEIAIVKGGKTTTLETEDIQQMRIEAGMVSIWQHGAKKGWFTDTGIISFSYAELGNARFFVYALEKLLGIRIN